MQVTTILHKIVAKSLTIANIRKTKINALIDMVESLISQKSNLTLTNLGRHMSGEAHVKHKIKRVDRWLANDGLYAASSSIYKSLFNKILRERK